MRELASGERLARFMDALARSARAAATVYLTGGASAVLLGWRPSTVDVDLKLMPEGDELLRALPRLKEELQLNVELAAPDQFLPALPGWRERSVFIRSIGSLSYFHYDFYAQALAKLERGHSQDLLDVEAMLDGNLVDPRHLLELFSAIEPHLYRFPAVAAPDLRRRVEALVARRAAP